MLEYMDNQLIRLRVMMACFLQDLRNEERGESNFVAVLLIIVIAVTVAVLLKDKLVDLVDKVFGKIDTFVQ
ncbi:MAG: hypothetical protein NC412_07410 [Roseburia sp.]|nr:hypothetical protein [Roseburia sp.]MCM1278556.1 hypothetical protein [Robinsoniella sp.]